MADASSRIYTDGKTAWGNSFAFFHEAPPDFNEYQDIGELPDTLAGIHQGTRGVPIQVWPVRLLGADTRQVTELQFSNGDGTATITNAHYISTAIKKARSGNVEYRTVPQGSGDGKSDVIIVSLLGKPILTLASLTADTIKDGWDWRLSNTDIPQPRQSLIRPEPIDLETVEQLALIL
jgi:hypothetical protein